MEEINNDFVPDLSTVPIPDAPEPKVVQPEPQPKQPMAIDPDLLKRILDQNSELSSRLAASDARADEFAKQIDVLRESVSRGRLEDAEGKRKPVEKPRAFLAVWDGKPVIGWKSEKNQYVYNPLNPNSVAGELLKTRLFLLDGTDSGEIDQVAFTRLNDRTYVRKVGEKRNDNNEVTAWVVEFEDQTIEPRQIEIHPQFINPN